MTLLLSGVAEDSAVSAGESLRVRVTWAPATARLNIEALECCGVPVTAPARLCGGEAEFVVALPATPPRAWLRWRLSAETAEQGEVDEIRIEARDAGGRWHLLGERLGCAPSQRSWTSEREFHSGPHRLPAVA